MACCYVEIDQPDYEVRPGSDLMFPGFGGETGEDANQVARDDGAGERGFRGQETRLVEHRRNCDSVSVGRQPARVASGDGRT